MRSAIEVLGAAALTVVVVGCDAARPAASAPSSSSSPSEAPSPLNQVKTYGELRRIMHDGQTGPVFRIRDATTTPHAFAVGALSELRGEVTLIDGEVWLAYPDGRTARVVRDAQTDEQAALFVVAYVPAWKTLDVGENVASSGLDDFVEREARAAGIDPSTPFPVRFEGRATVRYHVVDGSKVGASASHEDHLRSAITGTLEHVDVRLVGFYGATAQGVFTHMGQRTHFHVIDASSRHMGHVDAVEIEKGARLLLPDRLTP